MRDMVNISEPGHRGTAPPLSEDMPHLTINHEVAADLDSTNAFEGPEKLLEVWLAPSPTALPSTAGKHGLKAVSPAVWEGMLDMVNCKVLSIVKSDHVDAYLLSESSMFVFPHKIILKTCGTTTLLLGLRRLLHIAAAEAGFPFHNAKSITDPQAAATPYRVFYSRKNFLFPDKQPGPHRSWEQEVKFLDDIFEGGSAYMVGKINGDHWNLYVTSSNSMLTPPLSPVDDDDDDDNTSVGDGPQAVMRRVRGNKIPTGLQSPFPAAIDGPLDDETLEILMTNLDPEHAKQFYMDRAAAAAQERTEMDARTQEEADETVTSIDALASVFVKQDDTPTEGHVLGTVVSDRCGLSSLYPTSIYPGTRIDAFMFSPCGFSANGVIPAPPLTRNLAETIGHYFTVHVTPEPQCSFASFETNVPSCGTPRGSRNTAELIEHVVGIFRPGRFSVTLFEATGKARDSGPVAAGGAVAFDEDDGVHVRTPQAQHRGGCVKGYRRIDNILYNFYDYDLVFQYYEREGWVGEGGPRVGKDF